eukprot:436718-Amphidinium_carterae.1
MSLGLVAVPSDKQGTRRERFERLSVQLDRAPLRGSSTEVRSAYDLEQLGAHVACLHGQFAHVHVLLAWVMRCKRPAAYPPRQSAADTALALFRCQWAAPPGDAPAACFVDTGNATYPNLCLFDLDTLRCIG